MITLRHGAKKAVSHSEASELLLSGLLQGQEQLGATFCATYSPLIKATIVRTLRRYGARFTQEDVADLQSEIWLALLDNDYRRLRHFDPERGYRLSSWLSLIATNITIDSLRRRVSQLPLDCVEQLESLLVEEKSPDQGLEQEERASLAQWAMAQLSPDDRQFVCCCYIEERSPGELAAELGVAVNTVYARKFKVRQKLARLISDVCQPAPANVLAA